jgi:hypothetical protein
MISDISPADAGACVCDHPVTKGYHIVLRGTLQHDIGYFACWCRRVCVWPPCDQGLSYSFEGAAGPIESQLPTKTLSMWLWKRTSIYWQHFSLCCPAWSSDTIYIIQFRLCDVYQSACSIQVAMFRYSNITIRLFVMFELMIYFVIIMVSRYSRSLHGYTCLECVRPPLHVEAMVERCLRHTAINTVIG